jgi:hypothetical protein
MDSTCARHAAIRLLDAQKQIGTPQRLIHDVGNVVICFGQVEFQLLKIGRIRSYTSSMA